MAISVEKLIEGMDVKYGIKIAAGETGLNRMVYWVHIVEDNDVPPTLLGNELIFTTGVGNIEKNKIMSYVKHLASKDVSGLVLSIGRYYKELSEDLIAYCNEIEFPLFTISCDVPLVSVTYDLCKKIIRLDRLDMNLAESFKNAILHPEYIENYRSILLSQGFEDGEFKIYAIQIDKELSEEAYEHIRSELKYQMKHFTKKYSIFKLEGHIVIILQGAIHEKEVTKTVLFTTDKIQGGRTIIGESPYNTGFSKVGNAYRQAALALQVAQIQNERHLHWKDIGIYGLLLSEDREGTLKEYYQMYLGALEEYDQRNGTDLVNILKIYLENQSSVLEVSKLTFMHRNTVNNKIKKIKQILNVDLCDEDKMHIHIAFYIKNLMY